MNGRTLTTATLAAAACGLLTPAWAQAQDAAQDRAALERRIEALEAQLNAMQTPEGAALTDEARADEVRLIVREVMDDAGTRSDLDEEGFYAGINPGGKVFLASQDGDYSLELGAQVQVRYIANYQDGRGDEWENGFQLRRVKFSAEGEIFDFGYGLTLATERGSDEDSVDGVAVDTNGDGVIDDFVTVGFSEGGFGAGDVVMEDAFISRAFDIGEGDDAGSLEFLLGRVKLPFLREELISSKRQLAVDRSQATEYFTLNRAEQFRIAYDTPLFKSAIAISDGGNSGFEDFPDNSDAEIALTGRVDFKLLGDWDAAKDFVAWRDDEPAVFIGGAVHYETADEDQGQADTDAFIYTVDALVEGGGFSLMGAWHQAFFDGDAAPDGEPFGFVVQGGYNIDDDWQPFARYNFIDDDIADDPLQSVTAGVNYFFKKHNAKFTADAVWVFDGDNPAAYPVINSGEFSSGLGLRSGYDGDDDQVAIRTQMQLYF